MSGVKILEGFLEKLVRGGTFDRNLSRVKITAGGNGSLTGVLKVEKEDANSGGFLHGGMTALLVDILSSAALVSHPKNPPPGVSVNMNLSYMKAAPIGQEIVIKGELRPIEFSITTDYGHYLKFVSRSNNREGGRAAGIPFREYFQ